MTDNKHLYTETSIESLDPLAFTRLKPGVYAGDTTYATQLLVEILSNSIDEFRLGHGNKIEISIKGAEVCVNDYGQGFIVNSFREDGKSILEAAFSVINTSGKYREDGTYEGTSLGSFGIGSKLANFLSHWMQVITFRDGSFILDYIFELEHSAFASDNVECFSAALIDFLIGHIDEIGTDEIGQQSHLSAELEQIVAESAFAVLDCGLNCAGYFVAKNVL